MGKFIHRELAQRALLTAALLALFRVGYWIPVAGSEKAIGGSSTWSDFAALVAASDLGSGTLFALGIMPYISASIVFQLLGQVIPTLQAIGKDGESGRRRINEYVRYATVIVGLGQSVFWTGAIVGDGGIGLRVFAAVVITCGTMILMWIGEQIDAFGVGNGISLLIMGGIVSRVPSLATSGIGGALENGIRLGTESGVDKFLTVGLSLWALIAGIVVLSEAHRRISVISGKGRNAIGKQFIPIKVNQAGVMPVIFAGSVLLIPGMLIEYTIGRSGGVWLQVALDAVRGVGAIGAAVQCVLICFFTYFWTAVTFRPSEIAESLRESGVFVPGFRPGKRTEAYLEYVMTRLTLVSGAALAFVALLPAFSGGIVRGVSGTGLMIVVSVALDLKSRAQTYAGQ